jgi:hypothetical protein
MIELGVDLAKGGVRTALALALLLAACSPPTTLSPSSTTAPVPAQTTTAPVLIPSSTVVSPNSSPMDTTGWTTFESARYGFGIGHPSDWAVVPADHDWTLPGDADQSLTTGQEVFLSSSREVRVGAWAVSANLADTMRETGADAEECCVEYCQQLSNPSCGTSMRQWWGVVKWVVGFCRQSNAPSCTGVVDRAVPLCIERWDCHPGLLVPFENYVQAFLPEMTDDSSGWNQMIVVAVWRGDSDPTVARYGGSRQLLEAFLSTMLVCPARLDQAPWGCGKPSP